MRSRNVDVLRPAVELINFNLNVIKICGFPALPLPHPLCLCSSGERRGSTFKFKLVRRNVVFILGEVISAALTMELVDSRGHRVSSVHVARAGLEITNS